MFKTKEKFELANKQQNSRYFLLTFPSVVSIETAYWRHMAKGRFRDTWEMGQNGLGGGKSVGAS